MFRRICWHQPVLTCLLVLVGPGLAAQAAEGRQYLLAIGVERYDPQFFPRLNFAEDDVLEMSQIFKGLGYDIIVMTSQADIPARVPNTAKKIIDQLDRRAKNLEAPDTFVVALSGHGVQLKDDPVRADGSKETYFCPEEADLGDKSSMVPMSRILQVLADCKAERKLLLVDACRNETKTLGTRSTEEIELSPVGVTPRTAPKGTLALFSCASQERSFEHPELQHGVFCYHILKYLKGQAGPYPRDQLSVTELANYARRETSDYVFRHTAKDQSPVLITPGELIDWPLGKISTQPIEVGAVIAIAKPSTAVLDGSAVVGYAKQGEQYRVEKVGAAHLLIPFTLNGQRRLGWISRSDVELKASAEQASLTPPPVAPTTPPPSTSSNTPPRTTSAPQGLNGDWLNASTQAIYTIRVYNGQARLEAVIDDDAEIFQVLESAWKGTAMYWKYRVPSTNYIVEETVNLSNDQLIEGEYVSIAPDGARSTGSDSWSRIVPGAATLAGNWLNPSTGAIYTIELVSGQPKLVSVVDDDEEVFVVQNSSWDGASLSWTYSVPSTGYTVSETARLNGSDALAGEYTSTSPSGESSNGTDTWSRKQ